ncbi:MAG: 7-carboxy-7-deazaguanine synthase QueE [Candidatus Omnitrophica bacterium]|nr:7-carboxy-7-deazaguanine synthase QueE [Candidatus Omnitrophota bacterium]
MIKGKITEIFDSVQGEGLYLGEKQIFVRLHGCNMKCRFCDTRTTRFMEYHPDELLKELKMYEDEYHSVSFTGGEPLMQKDFLRSALELTSKAGYKNYLETNGTLPDALKEVIGYVDIVAMDLKFPSSTGAAAYWQSHAHFLAIAAQKEVFLKVVICNDTTDIDLRLGLELIKSAHCSGMLILQPNYFEDSLELRQKIEWYRDMCLDNNITACVIPQMQKVMWMP